MNVIVSNKQKNLLDNANIDAIKDLNGLFNVDELISNFKDYFFSRMIIDATSIVDFAKEGVLRKLVSAIGADKIILFLPAKPEPPIKFKELLVSLGIYNFTTNIDEVVSFLKTPNTLEGAESGLKTVHQEVNDSPPGAINPPLPAVTNNAPVDLTITDNNKDKKIVIGFKNVTAHAGSTTLIYLLKQHLEKNFNTMVEAIEIGNSDFMYYNVQNMINVNQNNLETAIANSKANVILIDLNNNNYETLCDDVIYLVEPSIIRINKLLAEKRDAFLVLKGKKVILNKSMLSDEDVSIFAREAGVKIYYNLPFVNDRVNNSIINDFINSLGIINSGGSHGLFGLFK